jgi:hypothetical protein
MNYKKQIRLVLFCIFLLLILLSVSSIQYFFLEGECVNGFGGHIGECLLFAIFPGSISLFSFVVFIFSIPLYFLKEGVYFAWRKFALWYLPIVAILILSAGGGSNGFNPGYGMDTESLTFFFSGLFALISLVLIIYKSIKLRGK